ncbi:M48 family metallopeptidase [Paractinoplanes atraurantiacus]|uniref:Zn-dependent protease with chaperone function n=1 Tax=Paractinoplanes atraurantiacus TaxID=1036182 RepID=A0A285H424_9ACTN|nr:M48 family metallopeptidase [Actinoplanes atraurantiacus]SNY30507.1 Zn-dependent protease with chaperone function [Actinoplanes atraurantiacus]
MGRSAAMLVGFLAAAWLQVVAALVFVLVVLDLLPGALAVQVAVPLAIATAGLLCYATIRALRLRRPAPAGVPVTRDHAPALWAMLDEAAALSAVAPPDGVTVVAPATATLAEQPRFGGLAGGRRELYLGLPLLQTWDEARLRAVVAHELAHGSPARGGRFAPMAHRGRAALARIVPRIPARNPAGPLLRLCARWFRAADDPRARERELAADRAAAEFAGPRAATAVLRDGPVLDGMQQLFHVEYLSPGWQTGLVPDDVFGGFLRVLAARAEEAAVLRARGPEQPGGWDAHPPLAERLAALAAITPEGPEPESPPAGDLIPDLPGLARALQAVAFPSTGRTVVTWDEFFGAARTAEMEREADASLRALSHAAGTPVPNADAVLRLAADGQLTKFAETILGELPAGNAPSPGEEPSEGEDQPSGGRPPSEEISERITELITLLLALAALHCGAARWRHSWTGTAELVAADGSFLDLHGPAALAADPATVGEARQWLAALGIDLAAGGGDTVRPAARVPVLGGVVNVLVDGARTDLLVVETGLVLVPGLPRSRHAEAKRRLTRLASDGVLADGSPAAGLSAGGSLGSGVNAASAEEGGAADAASAQEGAVGTLTADDSGPGIRFVPFADVASAAAVRSGRRQWEIGLRHGGSLSVRTALDSEELPGGWAALDEAVSFLTRTR